jgi:hypothetical protein
MSDFATNFTHSRVPSSLLLGLLSIYFRILAADRSYSISRASDLTKRSVKLPKAVYDRLLMPTSTTIV